MALHGEGLSAGSPLLVGDVTRRGQGTWHVKAQSGMPRLLGVALRDPGLRGERDPVPFAQDMQLFVAAVTWGREDAWLRRIDDEPHLALFHQQHGEGAPHEEGHRYTGCDQATSPSRLRRGFERPLPWLLGVRQESFWGHPRCGGRRAKCGRERGPLLGSALPWLVDAATELRW